MTSAQLIFENVVTIEKLEERLEMEALTLGSVFGSCISSADEF
jgi:hypothetical protein